MKNEGKNPFFLPSSKIWRFEERFSEYIRVDWRFEDDFSETFQDMKNWRSVLEMPSRRCFIFEDFFNRIFISSNLRRFTFIRPVETFSKFIEITEITVISANNLSKFFISAFALCGVFRSWRGSFAARVLFIQSTILLCSAGTVWLRRSDIWFFRSNQIELDGQRHFMLQ